MIDVSGGAVLARNLGSLVWNATIVRENRAEMGGGIMMTNAASIIVRGVSFAQDVEDGTAAIVPSGGTRSLFERNIAFEGAALFCFGCSKWVTKGQRLPILDGAGQINDACLQT